MQGREWERFAWLKSRVVAPRGERRERPRAGAALDGGRLRLSQVPRLRRVRGPAPAAPQDPRRGAAPRRRPARARQRRQAVARRHPRDRVHRAAAAGGARRAVPGDPHALDAERAAAPGRARADEAGDGRAPGRGLHLPAPRRAPHPVPRRPADACAADRPTPTWPGSRAASTCAATPTPAPCSTASARCASSSPPSSTRCCTTARTSRTTATAAAAAAAVRARCRSMPPSSLEALPPELATRVAAWSEQPKIKALRDESKLRLARLVSARGRAPHAPAAAPMRRGAALHRLARAAAAPRELPRAAGRAPGGAEPAAAPARPGALADALPDAPPRA